MVDSRRSFLATLAALVAAKAEGEVICAKGTTCPTVYDVTGLSGQNQRADSLCEALQIVEGWASTTGLPASGDAYRIQRVEFSRPKE